jgi:hypothetical protein
MRRAMPATDDLTASDFDAKAFLGSAGLAKTIVHYARDEVIFAQGDSCQHVLYVQSGGVKLSVLSKTAWPVSRFAWAARRRSRPAPSCASRRRRW